MNLFGENDEVIRTLGFYQPWGSLMLLGKIETRKVTDGRKPPFPKGKYLFYTTKKILSEETVYGWCGEEIFDNIMEMLEDEPTKNLQGYAIGMGDLKSIRVMENQDERECYVANQITRGKTNWCLEFDNVQRIVPFEFKFGKQGVGILPKSEHEKIVLADSNNSLP